MNHRNTLTTTCPCCRVSFELSADNIRQADFKRKFGKWDSVTKHNVVKAMDDEGCHSECDPVDDQDDDDTTEL